MRILVVLLVASLAACSAPRSARCKEVCDIHERCTESAEVLADAVDEHTHVTVEKALKFDETECVAACAALDRDAEGRRLVDAHIACVKGALPDCTKVLACR